MSVETQTDRSMQMDKNPEIENTTDEKHSNPGESTQIVQAVQSTSSWTRIPGYRPDKTQVKAKRHIKWLPY